MAGVQRQHSHLHLPRLVHDVLLHAPAWRHHCWRLPRQIQVSHLVLSLGLFWNHFECVIWDWCLYWNNAVCLCVITMRLKSKMVSICVFSARLVAMMKSLRVSYTGINLSCLFILWYNIMMFVCRTILLVSCIYCLGSFVLALTAIPPPEMWVIYYDIHTGLGTYKIKPEYICNYFSSTWIFN